MTSYLILIILIFSISCKKKDTIDFVEQTSYEINENEHIKTF